MRKNNVAAIQRQVRLPLAKSIEIALKGLRVRFYRSLITTMSLVLAIAFLSFVLTSNLVVKGLLDGGAETVRQQLRSSGYDIDQQTGTIDSSPKQRWILVLSLLVCVVGIVNAQLMAVTERFREIGTMKCLGALDRFVLRLFLLEAGMQGLAGALLGAIAGGLFALLNGMLHFGTLLIETTNWPAFLMIIGIATATGCMLSILGVIYPALVAARMQPVEAMRVEQ